VSELDKHKILQQVGLRIKKIRLQQKVSRYQLAFEVGTSEKHIRQIENGEISTSIFKIFQIAYALEVKPEEIVKSTKK
jgi:transcriptional regulator with XRE-family HTH domain